MSCPIGSQERGKWPFWRRKVGFEGSNRVYRTETGIWELTLTPSSPALHFTWGIYPSQALLLPMTCSPWAKNHTQNHRLVFFCSVLLQVPWVKLADEIQAWLNESSPPRSPPQNRLSWSCEWRCLSGRWITEEKAAPGPGRWSDARHAGFFLLESDVASFRLSLPFTSTDTEMHLKHV